jgi:hypothetical protein
MKKQLGKIESIKFGFSGYQDDMFGISIGFAGDGWGVGKFIGTWPKSMKRPKKANWTELDRDNELLKVIFKAEEWMTQAKVQNINDLVGIPVELTFKDSGLCGDELESWRILTEVL